MRIHWSLLTGMKLMASWIFVKFPPPERDTLMVYATLSGLALFNLQSKAVETLEESNNNVTANKNEFK